jgi:phosphoribosyl 1,2-cyclic phosphodiesterase
MLDCGLPWKKARELLGFKTSGVAGVLITHQHKDHCKGAVDAAKAGLDIYASQPTLNALQIAAHRANSIESGKVFSIGSWHVLAFETAHDTEGSLGFYMVNFDGEAFLYLTDSAYSPVRFANLSIIAVECNYMADILSSNIQRGSLPQVVGHRVRRSHMALSTVIGLLKANDLSRCREIFLLHLSDGNSDQEAMRRQVQETTGIATYVA